MPLTLPIVEQITLDMISALETVTTAAGCGVTLSVRRSRRQGVPADVDLVTVTVREADVEEDPDASQDQRWLRQPYALIFECFESDTSEYPARQRLQIATAWAEKVLRQNPGRSGLAINTEVGVVEWPPPGEINGGSDVCGMPVTAFYQRRLNDPFSQI